MKRNYVFELTRFVEWLNANLEPASVVERFRVQNAYSGKQLVADLRDGGRKEISEGYQPAKDCYLSALENFREWSKYIKKGE